MEMKLADRERIPGRPRVKAPARFQKVYRNCSLIRVTHGRDPEIMSEMPEHLNSPARRASLLRRLRIRGRTAQGKFGGLGQAFPKSVLVSAGESCSTGIAQLSGGPGKQT